MADTNVSIIMDVREGTTKRQKAITNISPTATDNELRTFANAVNALTTDTLDGVTRVEKKTLQADGAQIIGADVLVTSYGTGTLESIEDLVAESEYYVIDNYTGTKAEATFSFETPTVDGVHVEAVGNIETASGTTINYLLIYATKNANADCNVQVYATGTFGSLSKTVRCICLKAGE